MFVAAKAFVNVTKQENTSKNARKKEDNTKNLSKKIKKDFLKIPDASFQGDGKLLEDLKVNLK